MHRHSGADSLNDFPMSDTGRTTAPQRVSALRLMQPYLAPYRALLLGWLGFLALSSTATLSLPLAVRHIRTFLRAHAPA